MIANTTSKAHHDSTRAPGRYGLLRRAAVVAGLAGAVVAGVALPATAGTPAAGASSSSSVELVGFVDFCPFGTHHGPGSGCRGGSINDNPRVNSAASQTGQMYLDAAECAGKAVGKSLVKNRKKPSLGGIALGTISPALRCGQQKGY